MVCDSDSSKLQLCAYSADDILLTQLGCNRRTLSTAQKQAYISAVKCLQAKPSRLADVYAASRSRYDDFQASHVDLTPQIHWNVSSSSILRAAANRACKYLIQ